MAEMDKYPKRLKWPKMVEKVKIGKINKMVEMTKIVKIYNDYRNGYNRQTAREILHIIPYNPLWDYTYNSM